MGSWQGVLTGTGCPSKSELIFRRFSSSASGRKPASAQTPYRMGAAWPCQGADSGGSGQRGADTASCPHHAPGPGAWPSLLARRPISGEEASEGHFPSFHASLARSPRPDRP